MSEGGFPGCIRPKLILSINMAAQMKVPLIIGLKISRIFSIEKWYEASVAHLGIRLIWITEWTEVASIIRTSVENLRT